MDKADEYSEIDVAIVSKEFTGMPFYDVKKISKFREVGSWGIGIQKHKVL